MIIEEIANDEKADLLEARCFQPDIKIINKLKNLIEQDFRISRDVNNYAHRVGVTLYYLNSLTKHYLGGTVYDLLQNRVHEEVLYLLRNSMLSVKQITFEVGTCDPSYFCKCFKKIMGVTPLEYRKNNKVLNTNSILNKFSEGK